MREAGGGGGSAWASPTRASTARQGYGGRGRGQAHQKENKKYKTHTHTHDKKKKNAWQSQKKNSKKENTPTTKRRDEEGRDGTVQSRQDTRMDASKWVGPVMQAVGGRCASVPQKYRLVFYVVIAVLLVLAVVKAKRAIDHSMGRAKRVLRERNGCRGIPLDETIFVAIPSGLGRIACTARLVDALFAAAACPRRVHIGVCQTHRGHDRPGMASQHTECGARGDSSSNSSSSVVVWAMRSDGGRRRVEGGFRSHAFLERYRAVAKANGHAPYDGNVRVYMEPPDEAKGVANALYLIARYLYAGERYYATVVLPGCAVSASETTVQPPLGGDGDGDGDEHHGHDMAKGGEDVLVRPTDEWDVRAVADLQRAEQLARRNNADALLTMPLDGGRAGGAIPPHPVGAALPAYARFCAWDEYGVPVLGISACRNTPVRPLRTAFFASDFCMADGHALVASEPWDPWLQHLPLAACDWCAGVRLWTRGWDFFTPTFRPLLAATATATAPAAIATAVRVPAPAPSSPHPAACHAAPARRTAWHRHGAQLIEIERNAAYMRLWAVLGMLPGGTGPSGWLRDGAAGDTNDERWAVGTVRTLTDYRNHSGVDWIGRTAFPRALVGIPLAPSGSRHAGGVRACPATAHGAAPPFHDEDVVAKYGSWTEFFELTDYRPEADGAAVAARGAPVWR